MLFVRSMLVCISFVTVIISDLLLELPSLLPHPPPPLMILLFFFSLQLQQLQSRRRGGGGCTGLISARSVNERKL